MGKQLLATNLEFSKKKGNEMKTKKLVLMYLVLEYISSS